MPQIFCTLVGTHFRGKDAVAAIAQLVPGDTLQLQAEPENEYDENAVATMLNGEHVGYLSRDNNTQVAEALAAGEEPTSTVIDFDGKKPVLSIEW